MSDLPLGILDVITAVRDEEHPAWPALPAHWYWCRRHEKAEYVSEPTISHDPKFCVGCLSGDHEKPQPCIRIGPFMSEAEADRLRGNKAWDTREFAGPLGMKVEG